MNDAGPKNSPADDEYPLPDYRYSGARALVKMHAQEMRKFIASWHQARAQSLQLPATEDPNCQSLENLLFHVLRAARGYMTWMCEVQNLPAPDIRETPDGHALAAEADAYTEEVLEGWRTPLVGMTEEASNQPEYKSRWGPLYCLDAMLEHAVMHPMRHRAQLTRLMTAQDR